MTFDKALVTEAELLNGNESALQSFFKCVDFSVFSFQMIPSGGGDSLLLE